MTITSSDDAQATSKQHTKPCGDCPWRRRSIVGWLGGIDPIAEQIQDWLMTAHSDARVDCHTLKNCDGEHWQCAGVSIYRNNVVKRVEWPNLALPKDTKHVFATPMEFKAHHSGPLFPGTTGERT